MDLADFDNDISADDFALQRFSLIYPGKESSESDSCQKCSIKLLTSVTAASCQCNTTTAY